MSTFVNNDLTNEGRLLMARAQMGKRINFTRIVMGDGFLPPGTSIGELKSIVHPVVTVPISKMKLNALGTAVIGGMFSNADIDTEFFYRELALYAEGESDTPGVYDPEVLYCYGNAGEAAERIAPIGSGSFVDKAIDIITPIDTAANVTANIVRASEADEIGYDDGQSKLGADTVQAAVDALSVYGRKVIRSRVRDPTKPTYGLGGADDDALVSVILTTQPYTDDAEVAITYNGVDYTVNMSTAAENAPDGTVILKKMEE